jgi:hypothetical protein
MPFLFLSGIILIMNQSNQILLVLVAGVLINTAAVAEQKSLIPQTEAKVDFVSGGVGEAERNEMRAKVAGYNLSLLFTMKDTGEYLSDAKVRIVDQRGVVWLDTRSAGPVLLAKLKSGSYSVSATQNGYEIDQKVVIDGQKTSTLSFAWPKKGQN